MKNYKVILLVVISVLLSHSCNKQYEDSLQTECIINNHILNESFLFLKLDPSTLDYEIKGEGEILHNLLSSNFWRSLPIDIISRINLANPVIITDYDHSEIRTISFDLFSDDIQESLVFYCLRSDFIVVLTNSAKKEELIHHSVTDLSRNIYFDFYVNPRNRVGMFKVHMDMPTFKKQQVDRKVEDNPENLTCMQKTDNFGDCILCGIEECANDWLCALACGLVAPKGCLAAFGISCLYDEIVNK
ncbi:MAG: hypothetical protein IH591_03345 [Bacteroidales bacterium]|nr:hypothetical protein [Bacteroidales bacterium]